jgi:GxxExxY protein
MEDREIKVLADCVRENAFAAHCYFKNGYPEKIYENSLARRLRDAGHKAEQQFPLPVYDEDGSIVGDYKADILVNDILLLELKAVRNLDENHLAQLFAYLRASRLQHGMLINFGAPKIQIKKVIL